MSKKISGSEHALAKIFSSDFEYHIPAYQRPYAWGVDQASELFDDLLAFHKTEDEDGYFLGSIVLIKSEGEPYSEVIDGQQRLTTLTILLSAIASRLNGELQQELKDHIVEPGKALKGIKARPRLSLRERDNPFFAKYVQSLNLDAIQGLDPAGLENESQVNIRANSRIFCSSIDDAFGEDLDALAEFVTFILTRCFLVVVSTPNQQSAFRVFSVMNSRGLDLQPTDIIKADTIGKLTSEKERQTYNDKWEQMEVALGRNGFNDLFTYIRMIYAREKAKRSLLEEFRTHVLSSVADPKPLIDDVLEPYADALSIVLTASYVSTANAEGINGYLNWLGRIDNSDWIPPAIHFLARFGEDSEATLTFFERLERLAAYLHICRKNVNQRIEAYSELIREIGESEDGIDLDWVELDDDEIEEMREALDGNIYELTPRRRNYLILRLDSFLSDGAATYDPKILTIEHILPQTVAEDSEWEELWPEAQDRKAWVHRIANLVPLNKKKNSAAQNYDFRKKCDVYFSGSKNVSSYALTSQVLKAKSWNPEMVRDRQAELLEILYDNWDLQNSEQ